MSLIKTLACGGLALAGLAFHASAGAVCYVNKAATGANGGASWADAYTDLQSALGNGTCAEIWVAAGTYTPGAARGTSFAIAPGRAVYGGFAGGETARAQADPVANATILSGDIGTPGDASDNSYHVVTLDGTTSAGAITASTVLDGFTIQGGNASGSLPDTMGAGLYCNGNASGRSCDPTLSRLRFVSNTASYGGAVALRADGQGRASPTFSDVVFSGNTASRYGGAIYVWAELNGVVSPTIRRATFSGNKADRGGAIYNSSGGQGGTANAVIVNATFQGNDASIGSSIGNGGAIYNAGVGGTSAMTLTNVTFSGNTANGSNHFGGAMVNDGAGAMPVIANAIFWGDQAGALPEFLNTGGAQPTISHSIVAGSGGSGAGWSTAFGIDGGGNLDADPQLGALAGNGGFAPTMLPASGSPAIDAGDNASCPATDQRGVPRPQGGGCDIGAIEVVPPHRCYVNAAAAGANSGFSWGDAYVDLQSALREPLCNAVWVAKGVYKPTAGADRSIGFSIRPGLKVYGGFAGSESDAAQADPGANRTVLSGDIDGNDTVDANGVVRSGDQIVGANTYNVVVMDGTGAAGPIGSDTVLDGFAITGGTGWQYPIYNGSVAGGLYCNGVGQNDGHACSPTLTRLWFSGNAADWGGALFVSGGNGTGGPGGAAAPILSRSTFSGNRSKYGGGAAYLSHADVRMAQVTFSANRVTAGVAGAMLVDSGSPTLDQATFNGNSATGLGGALYVSNAALTVRHAILWGDSGSSNAEIYRSAGSLSVSDSVIQGGCPPGSTCGGVFSADPLLGPLQDNGGAAPTRLPGLGGAALDGGDPATCGTAPFDTDQRGVARPQGPACDIGAVELRQARLAVGVAGPGSVSADAAASTPRAGGGIAACAEHGGGCSAGYVTESATATVVLNLQPAAHAHRVSVTDTCGANGTPAGVLSGSTYTIDPLGADCAVAVEFATDAYHVGGTLGGLAGSGLVLQINGGETVSPASADTAFQFPTALAWGTHYDVAVSAQPTQPWQTCTIGNGSGDIGDADVSDIAVNCTTNTYTVGGAVDGLVGSGLVLNLNGTQTLSPTSDGAFVFGSALTSGSAYAVTVEQSPSGQGCTLERAAGTIGGANVGDVAVHCAALPAHLVLGIDDGRTFARYGQVVDYTITLRNDGFSTATAVPLDATLTAAFDAAYAHWQCFGGDGGAACTPSGDGPLHDLATVPPGRSLTWRVSVPVRFDSGEAEATFALALGGAEPQNLSDTNTLVLLRDGFDTAYGDGVQLVGAQAEAILGGDATHAFALPAASGERLDAVLVVRARSAELEVQRTPLDAATSLLRLSRSDADGREQVSAWVRAKPGAALALGSLRTKDGARVVLLDGASAPAVLRDAEAKR